MWYAIEQQATEEEPYLCYQDGVNVFAISNVAIGFPLFRNWSKGLELGLGLGASKFIYSWLPAGIPGNRLPVAGNRYTTFFLELCHEIFQAENFREILQVWLDAVSAAERHGDAGGGTLAAAVEDDAFCWNVQRHDDSVAQLAAVVQRWNARQGRPVARPNQHRSGQLRPADVCRDALRTEIDHRLLVGPLSVGASLSCRRGWVGGVAQWLGRRSLAGGLSLIYA